MGGLSGNHRNGAVMFNPLFVWAPPTLGHRNSAPLCAFIPTTLPGVTTMEVSVLSKSKLQTIICSSRMDEAEQFYGKVLGLPMKGKSLGALVYRVGDGTLRVSPVPSAAASEHTVLGFAVSNIRNVIGELVARGVTLEKFPNFPHDGEGIVHVPDGTQVAWFRDPDGNLLSVVQYLAEDGISSY